MARLIQKYRPTALLAVCLSLAALIPVSRAAEQPLDPAQLEFFEKHIRPVLAESCYECHSAGADKLKGGLLLDSKHGLLTGGDSGPAIVPGQPDNSLLLQAIRYTSDDLQMPPKDKKLPDDVIEHFAAWIQMGAPDPRTGETATPVSSAEGKDHWAFQPIQSPPLPNVAGEDWVKNPVDAFILARLEEKGIAPNPVADPRTLIRRASYDLTGLPPAPEQVREFESAWKHDPESAMKTMVERLLASPYYGERWGRYWLDVARYADTKGYLAGGVQRRYPFSYTYRDYVIRSLNEDLPFDRFIVEQLAADKLELGNDKRPLAALGFITLGRRFLNNQHDIIDDRIDVVTRGLMGLTVACARCHDHKFDPIPTEDYYSLYGVFSNSREPDEYPLLGMEPPEQLYQEFLAEKRRRQEKLDEFRAKKVEEAMAELREKAATYLWTALEASGMDNRDEIDSLARKRKLEMSVVRRWMNALEEWKKEPHPVLRPWFAFHKLPEAEREQQARELASKFAANQNAEHPLSPSISRMFQNDPPTTMEALAEAYGKLFAEADRLWREELTEASREKRQPNALEDSGLDFLRQTLYAEGAPANPPGDERDRLLDAARPRLRDLQAEIDEVDATHAGAPPRAMALVDDNRIRNPHVFVRGNSGNRGEEVPIQFIKLVAGEDRQPFTDGSGRLEMARAIASSDNPLTARVLVNRVWMHHFGKPLVRTPSDFGVRAEPPTHPEMLDWLAAWFMEEGWSLKKLHLLLLTSNAYRQSSEFNPDSARVDSENDLVWRMNRERLDFEAMRDTLLAVAGNLDLAQGGRSVEITDPPFSNRRTVYGFIERQNLPGLFRTFDFASPDTTSPQRFTTTVPQQALFLMNSPFVLEQARHLLERDAVQAADSDQSKINQLFRLAYQREPAPEELDLALNFVRQEPEHAETFDPRAAWQYGYGEMDETSGKLKSFQPLPHFDNYAWKGGPDLPDPKLGWVLLRAEGGHPGDAAHAAMRRWTAPADGVISIDGQLHHPAEEGNGVRSRVISSRAGILGEWAAHHGGAATRLNDVKVKKDDTIDFVTDCRGETSHDSFNWAPEIRYRSTSEDVAALETLVWDAEENFSGPLPDKPGPADSWQELAQAILVSNELFFID